MEVLFPKLVSIALVGDVKSPPPPFTIIEVELLNKGSSVDVDVLGVAAPPIAAAAAVTAADLGRRFCPIIDTGMGEEEEEGTVFLVGSYDGPLLFVVNPLCCCCCCCWW